MKMSRNLLAASIVEMTISIHSMADVTEEFDLSAYLIF